MRQAIVLAAALAVSGCSGLQNLSLGSLARVGAAAMPIGPLKEREIGFGIAATVAGRYELLQDPELTGYVNRVGQVVARQSIRGDEVAFRFGVLDTEDVNAFAAPGGYILVTRGALSHMESEAELAGVLAHEIAHVDEQHVLDQIRRADVFNTISDETQLAGSVLDSIAAQATGLLFTGLGREDELEADSVGLLYAAATGYRADGLLRFVIGLGAAKGAEAQGRLRDLAATHPPTEDRIAALRRQLEAIVVNPAAGVAASERFRRFTRGND